MNTKTITSNDTDAYRIPEMAGIPRNAAGDIIHEILTHFAGKKSTGTATIQKPR